MLFVQLPPTPTPFPTVPPESLPLQMPDISLWDMTDNSIQTWNQFNEVTVVFQAIVVLGIILFILMALFRYSKIITVVRND